MSEDAKVTVYTVTGMRVTFPAGKIAQKHPDRFATVHGTFYDAKGNKLSIVSKAITVEDASKDGFDINLDTGTLTMAAGERGRKPAVSETQDSITERLAALRS